jgi:hypothetical protein
MVYLELVDYEPVATPLAVRRQSRPEDEAPEEQ